jgi:hypothetical protein
MRIALIGATGRVGSRLATELLSRGHTVTGIALHVPTNVRAAYPVVQADATMLSRSHRLSTGTMR